MKFKIFVIVFVTLLLAVSYSMSAQNVRTTKDTIYVVKTYNGGEFRGRIIEKNSKELTIETFDRGKITIPMYEIEKIDIELNNTRFSRRSNDYSKYQNLGDNYFINKNAFSLPDGESYIAFSYMGPDFQFGVTDNFDIGIFTSWIAMPLIFNADYSIELNEDVHLGLGSYIGALAWTELDGIFYMPNVNLTFGTRDNNLNFKLGYAGFNFENENFGGMVFGIGALKQLNAKWTFTVDSMVFFDENFGGFIVPGLRYYTHSGSAFQFGFGGLFYEKGLFPAPIPFVQYMWNL